MADNSLKFGGINLVGAMSDASAREVDPGQPFRILLQGDFSGRASRGLHAGSKDLAGRKLWQVDRDNWEEILGMLKPELSLPGLGKNGAALTIKFSTPEDFGPDHLFEEVELFADLRTTRRQLDKPATFAQAADKIRGWADRPLTAPPAKPASAEGSSPQSAPAEPIAFSLEDLFSQTLAATTGEAPPAPTSPLASQMDRLLQEAVKPYLIPGRDADYEQLAACADEAISETLRAILHHPQFQALEAAWKSVAYLTRKLETDSRLQIYLLDCTKEEIASDVADAEKLASSALVKFWIEKKIGTTPNCPWAILVGLFSFAATAADAALLARLAIIAERASAPFVAAAESTLFGCADVVSTPDPDDWDFRPDADTKEAWQDLRSLPSAAYLGLVVPGFLLRLPYGRDTNPCERVTFEEWSPHFQHRDYLWGNGAVAVAVLLGQAYTEDGWGLRPGRPNMLDGLPLHVYKDEIESHLKPCAEVLLTDRAMLTALPRGPMLLLSQANSDTLIAPRIQGMTNPPRTLAGKWSSSGDE